MSTPIAMENLSEHLPKRVWYLSGDGHDLYCRRPYSFFFSSGERAQAFATAMGADVTALGVDSKEFAGDKLIGALQAMRVTRVFIDPNIDSQTGDVFGTILRLQEPN